MTQQTIQVVIRADAAGVAPAAKQVETALKSVATTAQVSSRQTAAAMRQLPAQFTDIATQLAGGANPLLVLLQQGGQIKDSFGGIGAALRGVAAAISPVALVVGAVAVAVAGVGVAMLAGVKQAEQLRDIITLTGNAAGLTADRLTDMASGISGSSQQTVGQARDIVLALAETGRTSVGVIESQARAAARIADLTGKSGRDIAASFASQLDAPAKFAAKLNEAYNFLSVADFKRIQALEQSKRTVEAATLTNDLLLRSLASQRDQLGAHEKAWDGITKAISRAVQAAKNFGKPDTTRNLIDQQFSKLQGLEKQLATNVEVGRGEAVIPGLGSQNDGIRNQIRQAQRRLFELQRQADIEATNASGRSDDAMASRATINTLAGNTGKASPANDRPLSALRDARDQYRADFLRSEKEFYVELEKQDKQLRELAGKDPLGDFIAERVIPNSQARAEQRVSNEASILQQLVDENARAGAQMIADERERGRTLIELDRQIGIRRLQQQELSNATLLQGIEAVNERADIALRSLNQQMIDSEQSRIDQTSQGLADSIANGMLDGFRRGQSFSDIILNEIKAQFARTVLSPLIRPIFEAENAAFGSFLSGIAGMFLGGGLSIDAGGAGFSPAAADFATGAIIRGRRATGGHVSAYGAYIVGENGPEVLQMGRMGGNVVPNHALGSNVVINQTINVAAGASRNEVMQAAAAAKNAAVAEIQDMMRRGSMSLRGAV